MGTLLRLLAAAALVMAITGGAATAASHGGLDLAAGVASGAQGRKLQAPVDTLQVNILTLTQGLQAVTVTWNKAASGTDDVNDQVELYVAPAGRSFPVAAALRYKHARGVTGSRGFHLPNVRADLQFVLIRRNGTGTPLAISRTIKNAVPNEPGQVHVVAGTDPSWVTVQWSTRNAQMPAVKWGFTPTALTKVAYGDKRTYTKGDMVQACGWKNGTYPQDAFMRAVEDGWVDPGTLHLATLKGLLPNTKYYYRVVDKAPGAFAASPVHSFTTAPAARGATYPLIVSADIGIDRNMDGSLMPGYRGTILGGYAVMQGIREVAATFKPRLHIILGDVSYSDGYLIKWQAFNEHAAPVLAGTPTIAIPGNHERNYYYDKNGVIGYSGDWINSTKTIRYGGECGIPYERLFKMPGTDHAKQWQSYRWGPVQLIALSSELDFDRGGAQQRWFKAELAKVDRSATPFVAVMFHRPIYIAAPKDDSDYKIAQRIIAQGWEDIIYKYKVDLVLNGHYHILQRTCAVYKGVCRPRAADGTETAPIHVNTGWGGPTDAPLMRKTLHPNGTCIYPEIIKTSGFQPSFGFLKVEASYKQLKVEAIQVSWECDLADIKNPDKCGGSMRAKDPPLDSFTIKARKFF